MSAPRPVAAIIGDVVGSKRAADRRALHRRVSAALEQINRGVPGVGPAGPAVPVTPLWITAGDEYQGAFATVGAALSASFRLRLALLPDVDVRHGLGWGPVSVLSDEPRVEDGPGWWMARAAIEEVETAESKAAWRSLRTAYRRADGVEGPEEGAVNAALVARDQLVSGAGAGSLSVLAGMLAGMSQKEIAADLGISASAVSQRIRRDGLAALLRVDGLLRTVGSEA